MDPTVSILSILITEKFYKCDKESGEALRKEGSAISTDFFLRVSYYHQMKNI